MLNTKSMIEIASEDAIVNISRQGRLVQVMVNLIVIVGLCIFGLGCNEGSITWSTEAYSPDGVWHATAHTRQWGGPGTAFVETTVYLDQSRVKGPPTLILAFTHQYSSRMYLKLEWITAKHLDVTYGYGESGRPGDHVDLIFQAVKNNGVEITAREIPSGTKKATTQ